MTRRRAGLLVVALAVTAAAAVGSGALLLRPATPTSAAGPPHFVDETAASGIDHRYDGGHIGGQLGWMHLGLGLANGAEARVQWPDGETGPWLHVNADEFSIIERGAGAARRWVPGGE